MWDLRVPESMAGLPSRRVVGGEECEVRDQIFRRVTYAEPVIVEPQEPPIGQVERHAVLPLQSKRVDSCDRLSDDGIHFVFYIVRCWIVAHITT